MSTMTLARSSRLAAVLATLTLAAACQAPEEASDRTASDDAEEEADEALELTAPGTLPPLGFSPNFGEQLGSQCANCTSDWYAGGQPLGIRYMRISALQLDAPDFTAMGAKFDAAWAAGMVPIAIITASGPSLDPARFDDLAAKATDAVNAFSGRPIVWEIWNEPHNDPYWPNPNAERFADLAIKIAVNLKAAIAQTGSPQYVIGPACSTSQPDHFRFFKAVLARQPGLLGQLDAVSVHGYQTPQSTGGGEAPEHLIGDFADLRAVVGDKPIFLSEYGWNETNAAVTPAMKAKFSARLYLLHYFLGASGTILYTLRDMPAENHPGAGLLKADGSPRSAYNQVLNLTQALNGRTLQSKSRNGSNFQEVFAGTDGSLATVSWVADADGSNPIDIKITSPAKQGGGGGGGGGGNAVKNKPGKKPAKKQPAKKKPAKKKPAKKQPAKKKAPVKKVPKKLPKKIPVKKPAKKITVKKPKKLKRP
jgi:hypothetical protein